MMMVIRENKFKKKKTEKIDCDGDWETIPKAANCISEFPIQSYRGSRSILKKKKKKPQKPDSTPSYIILKFKN